MKRHTRFYGGNDHFMIYKSDDGTDEERKPTKGYGGNGFSAVYEFGNGTGMMRNHGSITWRNFNPGAIISGSRAKYYGSIGNNGAFAVFPDENTGEVAVYSLLTSELYRDLTLADTIRKYAPANENDTEAYIKFMTDETGYSKDDIIKSLDVGRLYRAIKKKEGYIEGVTESIEKLSEVYTWRTVGDPKVRKEHADKEGKKFRWDDTSIDYHPGEAPGCRCWAMAHEYPYVPKDKKLHPYAIRILG